VQCPARTRRSPPYCLLRWSFLRSLHQTLRHRTAPCWTDGLPNLTCHTVLDRPEQKMSNRLLRAWFRALAGCCRSPSPWDDPRPTVRALRPIPRPPAADMSITVLRAPARLAITDEASPFALRSTRKSSEIPWPLAATTDENGDARPSSALIGACEPVSEIDAGAFPAPRTVCCEHAFQHRFLGWPCRASPAEAIRRRWQAVELIVERAAALDVGKDEVVASRPRP
jgi:hypothetical protein